MADHNAIRARIATVERTLSKERRRLRQAEDKRLRSKEVLRRSGLTAAERARHEGTVTGETAVADNARATIANLERQLGDLRRQLRGR